MEDLIKQYFELFSEHKGIKIQQSNAEVLQVINYLKDRKFSNMLELGVNNAGTFWLYGNLFLNDGGRFTAVDKKIRPITQDVAKYLEENKHATINLIQSEASEINSLDLKDLDFVHIDAAHDYDSVKRDFWNLYPKVIDGGVVLLHDSLTNIWPGVTKFREELESCEYDMTTFGPEMGITLILK